MQHSGAGHVTASSVVSHDPRHSKHQSGSVGVVDQTVAPGARQHSAPACSTGSEPVSSKRAECRSPTRGGVDAGTHVAAELDEVQHCHHVVGGAVPLCQHCDSEPIEAFAESAMLS